MSKKPPLNPSVTGPARGKRKRPRSNVIHFPRKRGRPEGSTVGPMDPMAWIIRQTHNPERLIAMLALTLIDEGKAVGVHITQAQAIDRAIAEFRRRYGGHQPRRVHMSVHNNAAGERVLKLKGEPAVLNRDTIADLLDRCKITRATLDEFRRWQPLVAALPRKVTR